MSVLGVVSGICNCVECGKEFQPYDWADDCYPCNGNGEFEMEMEWEYEPSMHRCLFCKGVGAIKYVECKKCKECKRMAEMEDEYNEADDDYDYCPLPQTLEERVKRLEDEVFGE